ncbi:MAG: class I SAM-dependent methyltransferase [Euryarchaeota archaeon]|nr:class I SAM-dependent methyltransferase [Euryarchaeota archaeon]
MMGGSTNRDSKDIMYLVGKDTVGAEIGVWKANTSANFVKRGVKELHLVDAWSVEVYKEGTGETGEWGSYENYLQRYKQVTGGANEEQFKAYYDKTYNDVVRRFKQMPHVHVHRMSSDDWFSKQEDNYFDWVYLDGDHSYAGVLRDLNNSLRVVKKGGLILGDDYAWPFQKHGKPGVTAAVDQFVLETGLELRQEGRTTQFSIPV